MKWLIMSLVMVASLAASTPAEAHNRVFVVNGNNRNNVVFVQQRRFRRNNVVFVQQNRGFNNRAFIVSGQRGFFGGGQRNINLGLININ
jgi:hypothetical protein